MGGYLHRLVAGLTPWLSMPLTSAAAIRLAVQFLALARRGALGAGLLDLAALAFGLNRFGGGFLAMGLRMGAEIAP